MTALPFTATARGLRLAVRLTPRASPAGLDGIVTDADGKPMLHIRVAAAPVEGAANAALIAFLAEALRLRKSDIAIVAGESARGKRLDISGDPAGLGARVSAWIAGGEGQVMRVSAPSPSCDTIRTKGPAGGEGEHRSDRGDDAEARRVIHRRAILVPASSKKKPRVPGADIGASASIQR